MKNDEYLTEDETIREIDRGGKAKKTPALIIALAALLLLGIMIYQALDNPFSKKSEEDFQTGAISVPPPRPNIEVPKKEKIEEEDNNDGKILIDQATLDEINRKYNELLQLKDILAKIEAERLKLEQLKKEKEQAELQKRRDATPTLFSENKINTDRANSSKNNENKDNTKNINSSSSVSSIESAKKIEELSYLLIQGTKIPAVLEVALHSELNSLLTAVTTQDIYSSDGTNLIIPKRSKIFGTSKRIDKVGQTRVFIIWDRIMTPQGVSIDIDSPNSDQIGRSGQGGVLDTHFFKRFGGALLLSMIQTSFESAKKTDGDININTGESESVIDDVIKNNINIPPTVYVHNGTKINIIANKDISFKEVMD